MTAREGSPALVVSDVCVAHGGVQVLGPVTISVRRGERVALVGPSGAGKTTLLGVAGTTIAPTAGQVAVLGSQPAALGSRARRDLRRDVASMAQDPPLPGPLRVVHNVNAGQLGRWSTARAIGSLIRPRDVDHVTDLLGRVGIAHLVWRRTDELSGGERQRVALARLLAQDAELILADEPVSSLDPARSREILELLCQVVADRRTLVCSLHQWDLAVEMFDRVVGLRGGVVVFDRPAGEVDDALRAELYALDAGPRR